ncbi:MAG: hypothetical protein IKX31_09755 [Muribaculaceae bacterium]|nr:hypothetical protein [Muribaculaceae bacterium]
MKNLFITIMVAAAMAILAIFGCAAQEHVVDAYNKITRVLDDDFITMNKAIDYRDQNSGEVSGVCIVKQFRLPGDKGSYIKELTHAMMQDSEKAYHSASGKAGSRGVTYAIAYGTGKNDFELIGADNDMNFMVVCFKDKQQSDFRTSYAIEWKQDNDDCYLGKIYKIYGKKPGDYQTDETLMFKGSSGNGFTLKVDSLIDLNSFKALEMMSPQLEMLGERLGNTYNIKVYSSDNDTNDDENTTWLATFALLTSKYKEKVKQSPRKGAAYATELLQMCKRADGVITESEKKLCIKSLKECQKSCSDTFVNGLLDEAINWLNGKNKNS